MTAFRYAIALSGAILLASAPAQAQMRRTSSLPPSELPPAGMCRIWLDGVPANRQPAATDCTTARASAPANSRVIYGPRSPGSVYGTVDPRNDPRLDPRDSRYDARLDPRSPQYDADYARRVLNDGRYANNGRYGVNGNNGKYGNGDRDKWSAKERAKWEREQAKREHKRDKEWRKDHKHDRGDGDDDDDRDHRDRDRNEHRGRGHDRDDH